MTVLWYPDAERRPGPPNKTYAAPNLIAGAVLHSMVGSLAGAMAELDRPSRDASWCFSITQAGMVLQHYPLTASTWHCGSQQWNTRLVGIEHEGGPIHNPSEPLTPRQLAASVELVKWIALQGGWTPARTGKQTLFEHREVSPSNRPTACPSGRIPWDAYVSEGEPMAESNAYIVEPGDNLSTIASHFGQTVAELAERNDIANPNVIAVGQVLRLTDGAPMPLAPPIDLAKVRLEPSGTAQAHWTGDPALRDTTQQWRIVVDS